MKWLHASGTFAISPLALSVFRMHEQHAPDALEAGGMLVGQLTNDRRDVVVETVTTPFPGDERTRLGFYRESPMHYEVLRHLFEKSGGALFEVGNWHTHAEPIPVPSEEDLAAWRGDLRRVPRNGAAFFVIVGQLAIGVWQGDPSTGDFCLLGPA